MDGEQAGEVDGEQGGEIDGEDGYVNNGKGGKSGVLGGVVGTTGRSPEDLVEDHYGHPKGDHLQVPIYII